MKTRLKIFHPELAPEKKFTNKDLWFASGDNSSAWTFDENGAAYAGSGSAQWLRISGLNIGQSYRLVVKGILVGDTYRLNTGDGTIVSVVGAATPVPYIFEATGESIRITTALAITPGFFGFISLTVDPYQSDINLTEDTAFPITFSVADIRNPEKRTLTYSKTITIPADPENNKALGHIYEIGGDGSFDPRRACRAVVERDGQTIFDGRLQLLRINRQGDGFGAEYDFINYEVALYSRRTDFLSALGEKKLSELSLSEYSHPYTMANIRKSGWYAPFQSIVPDLDRYWFSAGVNTIVKDGVDIQNWILGNELVCEFVAFDSDGYVQLSVTSGTLDLVQGQQIFAWRLDNDTTTFFNSNISTTVDPEDRSLHSGYATVRYVVDSTDFVINLRSDTFGPTSNAGDVWWVRGQEPTGEGYAYLMLREGLVTSSLAPWAPAAIPGSLLRDSGNGPEPGDVVTQTAISIPWPWEQTRPAVYAKTIVDKMFNLAGFTYTSSFFNSGVFKRLVIPAVKIDPVTPGSTMDPTIQSTVKLRDIFQDLIKTFNLYVMDDPNDPRNIIIETRDEFYDFNNRIDWTGNLDTSRKMEITPLAEVSGVAYSYSWGKTEDRMNRHYTETFDGLIYGEHRESIINDFAAGVVSTQATVIKPTVITDFVATPGIFNAVPTRLVTSHITDENDIALGDPSIRLLWFGARCTAKNICFNLVAGQFETHPIGPVVNAWLPFVGYAGHLDNPWSPSFDLNFALPRETYYGPYIPLIDGGGVPMTTRNMFTEYHESGLREISSKRAKLITCWMRLSAVDIAKLDFRIPIIVDGHTTRLNRIVDYDALGDGLTKVELILATVIPKRIFANVDAQVATPLSSSVPSAVNTETSNDGTPVTFINSLSSLDNAVVYPEGVTIIGGLPGTTVIEPEGYGYLNGDIQLMSRSHISDGLLVGLGGKKWILELNVGQIIFEKTGSTFTDVSPSACYGSPVNTGWEITSFTDITTGGTLRGCEAVISVPTTPSIPSFASFDSSPFPIVTATLFFGDTNGSPGPVDQFSYTLFVKDYTSTGFTIGFYSGVSINSNNWDMRVGFQILRVSGC